MIFVGLSLLNVSNDESQWTAMLSTHPPTEERIERLIQQSSGSGRVR